jgi:hypothetical protein
MRVLAFRIRVKGRLLVLEEQLTKKPKQMKKYSFILFSFLALVAILPLSAATNADTNIVVSGTSHPLRVSIPSDYNPEVSYPLIVGLHYCGGTSDQYRSKLLPLCDSLDVIVVCPDNNSSQITNPDFILASIDTAKSIYNINGDEVYLTGMSCNGLATLQMGLNEIYPFKGIFPWVPYFSVFNETSFNFDSQMPTVVSVGTSDANYTTILRFYDSLRVHQPNVDLVIVQGIGHTLDFAGFSNEMIRCMNYLTDTNSISIGTIDDVNMIDNDPMLTIKVKVTHQAGQELMCRALSSRTGSIGNPETEFDESGDSILIHITPKLDKAGLVYIILEVSDKNGPAIEQQVFKVIVEKHVSGVKTDLLGNFEIFPNPVEGQLNVNSIEQILTISIFDCNGNLILREDKFNTSNPLNVSLLTSGIYIVKAVGNQVNYSQKIIVQR